MKTNIAIASGKIAGKISKMMGKGGNTIPGVTALKIEYNLIKKLANQIENIVLVTGTNGKTTTANLISQVLKTAGKKVLSNTEGANMITGITACFVNSSNILGKLNYDCAVLEVDEASIPKILKQITPKAIVVTNFFRDQLDRYGEIDTLIAHIEEAIKPINTKLILNADDPFVVRLNALGKKCVYYGINKDAHKFDQYEVSESRFCPKCGRELEYSHIHYGQLGYYSCTCGFERPNPEYEIQEIQTANGTVFHIENNSFMIDIPGNYNIYNALGAISCVTETTKVKNEDIANGLLSYRASNGRMQRFQFENMNVLLNLVKNPAGLNVSLSEVLTEESNKQIGLFLNDLDADGRDVSWIWDADFERLNRKDIKKVICSGRRAYDMALRIKYAGISEDKIIIEENIQTAVKILLSGNLNAYLLPTYTLLESVKKILEEAEKQKNK